MISRRPYLAVAVAAILSAAAVSSRANTVAAPAGAMRPIGAWVTPFAPTVSNDTLTSLSIFLGTPEGQSILAESPGLNSLYLSGFGDPAKSTLVGALLPPTLEASIQAERSPALRSQILEQQLRGFRDEEAERKVGEAILSRVDEINAWIRDVNPVEEGAPGYPEFLGHRFAAVASAEALAGLAEYPGLSESINTLQAVAQLSKHEPSLAKAKSILAQNQAETPSPWGAQAQQDAPQPVAAADAVKPAESSLIPLFDTGAYEEAGQVSSKDRAKRVALANSYVEKLLNPPAYSDTEIHGQLLDQVVSRAKASKDEAEQRIYARGIIGVLEHPVYSNRRLLVDKLVEIGTASPFDNVKNVIMEGVADNLLRDKNVDYKKPEAKSSRWSVLSFLRRSKSGPQGKSQSSVEAVAQVALSAEGSMTKGFAIALLERERDRVGDTDYTAMIEEAIARVYASRKTDEVPLPPIHRQPRPIPGVPAGDRAGFFQELLEGAKNHPAGAFFMALQTVSVGFLLAKSSALLAFGAVPFSLAALAVLVPALAYVGGKGLWRDHPVSAFFQMVLVSGLLAQFATKASIAGTLVNPLQLAILAAGLLAASAFSVWSAKNHRPWLGFLLTAASVLISSAYLGGLKVLINPLAYWGPLISAIFS